MTPIFPKLALLQEAVEGLGATRPIYEGVPTSNREGLVLWECAYEIGLNIGCVRLRVSLEQ